MQRHHVEDIILYVLFIGEAPDKGFNERHSFYLMLIGVDASVLLCRRNYFAKIVSQRQQHEAVWLGHAVPERSGPVYDLHRVGPDIAFRVKDRILFKAYGLLQLREPYIELVHRAQ